MTEWVVGIEYQETSLLFCVLSRGLDLPRHIRPQKSPDRRHGEKGGCIRLSLFSLSTPNGSQTTFLLVEPTTMKYRHKRSLLTTLHEPQNSCSCNFVQRSQ